MMSLNMLIEFGEAFDFTGADFTRGAPRPASAGRKSSTWRARRAQRSPTSSAQREAADRGYTTGLPAAAYVFRSATAGSIRAARQAGPTIDSAAVTPSTRRDERECRRIERPHAEQHRLDQAPAHGGQHQTDRDPGADDAKGTR